MQTISLTLQICRQKKSDSPGDFEANTIPIPSHTAEAAMDNEGFGNCSNTRQCEAVCPKAIFSHNIARMNREYFKASFSGE